MAGQAPRFETVPVQTTEQIVQVRQLVRARALELGFSLVDQTKIVTAASELARNTIVHGGGGQATVEVVEINGRRGLKLVFEDRGRGIPDIERALQDGFTTGAGLGLGLGGARRLSNEFHIESEPGAGTRVTIVRWRS